MVRKENLSAANSRIRDADIAEETADLTKNQVLMQSGVAVLGQANASIKAALNLLGQGGMS
jgi:flagellin